MHNRRLKEHQRFNWVHCGLRPNYILIPITHVTVGTFNHMYQYVLKHKYHELDRTKSGGISIAEDKITAFDYAITIKQCDNYIVYMDLIIHNINGWCRLKPSTAPKASSLSGHKSYIMMKKEFAKDGINLDNYAINNGYEIKKTINKPSISLYRDEYANKTFEHVHHLDLNSAYPAGIVNSYPELGVTIQRIFEKRKTNKDLKLALDSSIGYMQSKYCKYKYAELSKAGINWCRSQVDNMCEYLWENDRQIILTNTDGIWYSGEPLDLNETKLGGWKTDHRNCKLRAKSAGCYEYIENGEYHPVVRGFTRLDKIKTRDKWSWGDIYQEQAEVVFYNFNKERGLING